MDAAFYFGWEAEVILLIQSVLGPVGITVMSVISMFGEETLLIAVLGYLYWGREKELGEMVTVNLITTATVCPFLKNIFFRLRPYFVISGIKCLKPVEKGDIYDVLLQGYSFPSAHTASAAAAYGTLASESRKHTVRIFLYLLIAAVGISRFSLGVHYPTDVIAGAVLGSLTVILGKMVGIPTNRKAYYIILIMLWFPGLFFCTTEDFFTCYGLLCGVLTGILYERKHVDFRTTDSYLILTLRILFGTALFTAVANVMKIPFAYLDVAPDERLALIYRSVRYAAASFVTIGLYPHIFEKFDSVRK